MSETSQSVRMGVLRLLERGSGGRSFVSWYEQEPSPFQGPERSHPRRLLLRDPPRRRR